MPPSSDSNWSIPQTDPSSFLLNGFEEEHFFNLANENIHLFWKDFILRKLLGFLEEMHLQNRSTGNIIVN